jgi:hypothetical protein
MYAIFHIYRVAQYARILYALHYASHIAPSLHHSLYDVGESPYFIYSLLR